MDMNKDEAERCIQLAENYINVKNREKAEKFLHKAERLYPTQKAKDLLLQVQFMAAKPAEAEQIRKRNVSAQKEAEDTPQTPQYTQAQLDAVKRINRCKDYYEIFGVNKDAPDSELKKSYKRLALQFHPDKNKAPGAAEAFKKIGNAMAVLIDAEKRKNYDLYGPEDERVTQRTQRRTTRFQFETDDSDEIFRMFFGTNFPGGNVYYRRNGRWEQRTADSTTQDSEHVHRQRREQNNYSAFVQLLPLIIAIVLSVASNIFVSDPPYSLQVQPKYPIQRTTANLKIPYFVKNNFATEYQGSVRRLEMSVEEEFLSNLRHSCYRERRYRESMMYKAREFRDQDLFHTANNMKTPSCDRLKDLER